MDTAARPGVKDILRGVDDGWMGKGGRGGSAGRAAVHCRATMTPTPSIAPGFLRAHLVPASLGAVLAVVVLLLGAPGLWDFSAVDHPDELLQLNVSCLGVWSRAAGEGVLPLWIPENLHGHSLFDDSPCLVPLHPMVLVAPLLGPDAFVRLAFFGHAAFAGAAMTLWLLARGLSRGAALLGAVMLSGSSLFAFVVVDGNLDNLPVFAAFPGALAAWTLLTRRLESGSAVGRSAATAALLLGAPAWSAHTRLVAVALLAWGLIALADIVAAPAPLRRRIFLWAFGVGIAASALAALWVVPALAAVAAARTGPPPEFAGQLGHVLPTWGLPMLLFPRPVLLDARSDHVGILVILAALAPLRMGRATLQVLLPAAVLVLLGLGAQQPLAPLLRPLLWLLYPAESMAAAMAVFMWIALAAGGADALAARAGTSLRRWSVVFTFALGAAVIAWGSAEERAIYDASVTRMTQITRASWFHGWGLWWALLVAVVLSSWRGRALFPLLLVVGLVDGVVFYRRVDAAVPSDPWPPSAWVNEDDTLRALPAAPAGTRVLSLPQLDPRGFQGTLLKSVDTGHGWFWSKDRDPTVSVVADTAAERALPVQPNHGMWTGREHVGGRTKVPPMPYSVLTAWFARGLPRPGEELQPPPGAKDPSERGLPPWQRPELFQRLLEILTVHSVLSPAGTAALPGTERVTEGALTVDRVVDPRPAAWWTPGAQPSGDAEDHALRTLDPTLDLRRTTVIAPGAALAMAGTASEGRAVEVKERRFGRWSLHLPEGAEGGVVVVSDRPQKGWTARVDGRPASIVQANLVQMAVVLPPGARVVELRFVPPGAAVGLGLWVCGVVLLVVLVRAGRAGGAGPRTLNLPVGGGSGISAALSE